MALTGRDIAFRVDASLQAGTGHVVRCLALAEALVEAGATCRFICREQAGDLRDMVRAQGHAVDTIPATSREDWQSDAVTTLSSLVDPDWLVVDHYGLDHRWERLVAPATGRLMAIDDLANRVHACDLLLDQTLGRKAADYDGLVPASCNFLLGPDVSLLRPGFAELRRAALARRERASIRAILISMGGIDEANVTSRVLSSLEGGLDNDMLVTVILGSNSPHKDSIRVQARLLDFNTRVLEGVEDMARLMCDSDLAIGAGGSTAWERCCMGLPSIIVPIAQNQEEVAARLRDAGATIVVRADELESARLLREVLRLGSDTTALGAMSAAAAAITDGTGAKVAAKSMDSLQ
jgi:UDP-2,4-diacetamido-2,4,6-trideoxy-beta-L-altropyranose hydrolase